MPKTASRSEPWTPGPWQFAYGDLYDHGEDGDANGFTVLMAGARTMERPENETPGAGADRIGKALVIHQVRIAEEIFPEDGGYDEAEANARLIAAAPVMVAALQAAPDIHALTPDQFYAAYCNWNTLVRMAALADARATP